VSITDAMSALADLADGRQPDQICLAMGVAALRERAATQPQDAEVFEEAIRALRRAHDRDRVDGEPDGERVLLARAEATALLVRLGEAQAATDWHSSQVEAASRMVELQAERLEAALDERRPAADLVPDFHFLIVAMRRLRRGAALAMCDARHDDPLARALVEFDGTLPFLSRLPQIGERLDDAGEASGQAVLHADPHTRWLTWGTQVIDVEAARRACRQLHAAAVCRTRVTPRGR
jgi:hypothetical protein